jgi:hypothetical protein
VIRAEVCPTDVGGIHSLCHNYEWMMLELHDQAVREHSGGAMIAYLGQRPIPNWAEFHQDTEADDAIWKADSLYFEARKPLS